MVSSDPRDLLALLVGKLQLELVNLAEILLGEGEAGQKPEVRNGGDLGPMNGVDAGRDHVGDAAFASDVIAQQGRSRAGAS